MTLDTELTGFIRDDGRVGFRNYVAVAPLSGCVQGIVNRIAEKTPGAVALTQLLGCDLSGTDADRLGAMLGQLANHPNVGGALFLTMSCAATNTFKLNTIVRDSGRLSALLNFNTTNGTTSCVAEGVRLATEMAEDLAKQERKPVPVSSIVMGTKCGASDTTSFKTCHPIVGSVCDRLVDMGATVVLSEDNELMPAVEQIASRAVDDETAERVRYMVSHLIDSYQRRTGLDLWEFWGEREAAVAQSLGHASKAGTRPIQKVLRLGEDICGGGLVILDAPNSDLISITSMTASGCNLLMFTTGRGTPVASPLAPTIKVTANPDTYERLNENIDVLVTADDASSADRLLQAIVECANGKPTKAEILGHGEMFIPLEGVTF